MREILFKGKRVDNGEWVYGLLARTSTDVSNIVEKKFDVLTPVYTNTVGQYTGLTDKNGKKIFEGDILKCVGNKCVRKGVLMDFEEVTHVSVVEWWNSYCNCGYRVKNQNGKTMMIKQSSLSGMDAEIIGNIFDNPELMKE